MNRMLLTMLSLGLMSVLAAAQDQPGTAQNQPTELPPTQPRYEGGGYGGGGYGRGGGGYGVYGGGYGMGGEAGYALGGMMGRAGNKIDPRQTRKLIDRWKVSKDGSERANIEQSLREMLKVEFGARLAAHEKEIQQLEEKVQQLRQRLDLRRDKQDEIVGHRLQQLLRDAQGLGWGSEGTGERRYLSGFQSLEMSPSTEMAPSDPLDTIEPSPDAAELLDPQPVVAPGEAPTDSALAPPPSAN